MTREEIDPGTQIISKRHCDGAREKAANMLGISMATLYRKIEPKKK